MKDFLITDEVLSQPIAVRLEMIDQARQLFGVEFAKGLWIRLGLPTVGAAASRQRRTLLGEQVARFIRECLDPDPLSELRASIVFAAYRDWCDSSGVTPLTAHVFGRLLGRAGVSRRHSNTTIYVGVRLTPALDLNPEPQLMFGATS